jgi:hypothetical protein
MSVIAAGCGKAATSAVAERTPLQENTETHQHIIRGRQLQSIRNDFHQLGIQYNGYLAQYGKPPGKPEDFLEYIRRDQGKVYRSFKDGTYVLNVGPKTTPRSMLAYEKGPDLNGKRVVVFHAGHVEMVEEKDFQEALKKEER